MANAKLFNTVQNKTNTVNAAGGNAYQRSDKAALAQFAATCMFGNTYYTDAKAQLTEVLELAKKVPVDFLAKVAIYSRHNAYLKDMPALLVAVLATRDSELCKKVFPRVIDNGKMLRNFVQIMRSGVVGRSSLGTVSKRLVQKWITDASDEYLFKASVGNDPSLADVIKMVHPRPVNEERAALYAYLIGKPYDKSKLCTLVQKFEDFKSTPVLSNGVRELPDVPFQMLTALQLTDEEWKQIAKNGAWQFTRMNLNTFSRHNVLKDPAMVDLIAARLQDKQLVKKARQYPYQVYSAYKATEYSDIPAKIQKALHKAVEACAGNVPEFEGSTAVLIDVSASMGWAGPGKTANVKCSDVAGLFAAIIVNRNNDARVYAFDHNTQRVKMNPLDSIFTNTSRMASLGGGGTDMSAGIKRLIDDKFYADNVIIVSDNESWMDAHGGDYRTGSMKEFDKLKRHNPNSKLVLIDLTPSSNTQVKDRADVLNVGGFSDAVFDVISSFSKASGKPDFWVDKIEREITL